MDPRQGARDAAVRREQARHALAFGRERERERECAGGASVDVCELTSPTRFSFALLCACLLFSVRRAFEYTISEVEEKWKGNFLKLQSLLEQRGSEIAVLQRRLLTALGQKSTVTGTLKWH